MRWWCTAVFMFRVYGTRRRNDESHMRACPRRMRLLQLNTVESCSARAVRARRLSVSLSLAAHPCPLCALGAVASGRGARIGRDGETAATSVRRTGTGMPEMYNEYEPQDVRPHRLCTPTRRSPAPNGVCETGVSLVLPRALEAALRVDASACAHPALIETKRAPQSG